MLFQFFNPFYVFAGVLFVVLMFVILREVLTWYWKINRIVDALERIEEYIKKVGIINDNR